MKDRTSSFVGRRAERERLGALLAAVRAGGGHALVVSGPPGIGKSALLDELERSAGGLRVLRATGVEAERELPARFVATASCSPRPPGAARCSPPTASSTLGIARRTELARAFAGAAPDTV